MPAFSSAATAEPTDPQHAPNLAAHSLARGLGAHLDGLRLRELRGHLLVDQHSDALVAYQLAVVFLECMILLEQRKRVLQSSLLLALTEISQVVVDCRLDATR